MPSSTQIANGLSKLGTFLRASQWHRVEDTGLTPTQSQILLHLIARGADRITAVAEEIAVTQPTASDAVAALVRKGLLRKANDPADARAVLLHPTAAGRRIAKDLALWPDVLLGAVDSLLPDEQAALLRGLTKIIRDLQHQGAIPVQRMCASCRFFRPSAHENPETPHHCDFVNAAFGEARLRLDCGDHEAAPPSAAAAAWQQFADQKASTSKAPRPR
ncbi:MAG: MarR family winged helix-turn-helix transcriptional regulator [Kiloniellaceae bacterium]